MERRKLSKQKNDLSAQLEQLEKRKGKLGKVSLIVKVKKEGYVPEGLAVRKKISPWIFTADASIDAVKKLQNNKDIESISFNESLPLID